MKRPKVCVYLLMLYSKIAIYSRKEHFHRKKSRTSRDRPDGTTHTGASLETHNYYLLLLLFGLIHISLTFSERDVGTALSYRDKTILERQYPGKPTLKVAFGNGKGAIFENSSKLRASLFMTSRWPRSSGQTNYQVHPESLNMSAKQG